MSIPQQKFREIVFQLLFSYDLANPQPGDMQNLLAKELAVSKKSVREAQDKVEKIQAKLEQIDQLILSASTSYNFARIQKIELNIIRLGIYEILFDEAIPPKVAIAEAIRLARKFSTREAASFINAILDSLLMKNLSPPPAHEDLENSFKKMLDSEQIAKEVTLNSGEHDDQTENPEGSAS